MSGLLAQLLTLGLVAPPARSNMAGLLSASEVLFAMVFVIRAAIGRLGAPAPPAGGPATPPGRTAWAAPALAFHAIGIVLVCIAFTPVLSSRADLAPSPRLVAGIAVLLAASALAGWAVWGFRSWRLLARLDADHELCIEGPFRFVRHPIYLAMGLWAVGNLLAFPSATMVAGAAVILIGGDLRARIEERLLVERFGERYREYAGRVSRFLPGVY